MNKTSYASNFAIGVVLIVVLQPWLVIGGLLYDDWAHYGPGFDVIIFLAGWAAVFLGAIWGVFVKFRQALKLASNLQRKVPVIITVVAGISMASVSCFPFFTILSGARWVPAKEPTEDRRIVHPLGFSIVAPPGWKARIWNFDNEEAGIALGPGYKGRHGPHLGVTMLPGPPDLSQFHETTFSEFKAFERTVAGTGENARLGCTLVVDYKGRWYHISYGESRAFESSPRLEFPEIMKRYMRSFKPAR